MDVESGRDRSGGPVRVPAAQSGDGGRATGPLIGRTWGPSPRRPLISAGVSLWYTLAALWWSRELPGQAYDLYAGVLGTATVVYLVRAEVLRRRRHGGRQGAQAGDDDQAVAGQRDQVR